MAVTVRAVTQAVGAEISGVDLRRLGDSDFAAIERAWTDHSMILLRGQKLGDDDLLGHLVETGRRTLWLRRKGNRS